MKKNKKYSGIIVPAATPLTDRFGIDETAVSRMLENFYSHKVSPFILGTTGEAASLSIDQKKIYVNIAGKLKKQNTILYAGISSNIVEESVSFANFCADNGVDAVAATVPSYYTLTENQIKKYFENLADKIPLPLIIYNIPATTHMSIPLHIIDDLSHHSNIIATKDSERSEKRLQQSLCLWKGRDDFGHFLGWAAKSAEALLNGSDGLIPSTGNYVPGIYEDMLKAVNSDNKIKAIQLQQLSDEYGALYQSGKTLGESLWALKVLMQEKGLCSEFVMPPLQPLDVSVKTELLINYKILFEKHGY